MITKEIKNLFEFIDFLYSNIDDFKKYDKTIEHLYFLDRQRKELNPQKNFKDKLRYDKIQTEIKEKIKPIKKNIIEKIQYETKKNDIYDWNTDNINGKITLEIHKLKDSFNDEDIPIIILHKKRYIEFRTKTNYTYFNDFFFRELDEQLKVLFDFFNESTVNEFESFEIKTTKVNNFQEAFEQLQQGNKKLSLHIDLSNDNKFQTSSIEQPKTEQTKTYPKLHFKDFFIKDIDKLKIDAIKKQFCNLKGKNIAILIQLLQKEKIITIIENSKNQSRKHFVEALLGKTVSMQNINSYLSFNNDKHIDTTKTDYIKIEKELNKIIKKPVV